jgi:hypothetical protein
MGYVWGDRRPRDDTAQEDDERADAEERAPV